MKKLSIVTTTYKSEKYLKAYFENITSLEGFNDFEIVLVANEPNEAEKEIINEYKEKFPDNIRIEIVPRESIATSTNRGFNLSQSEYVTIADVDDIKTKDCYARQMATLDNNQSADYTYGDFVIVPRQGVYEGLKVNTIEFNKDIATRHSIVGPNHFFRKKMLEKTGLWDEQLKSGSDFDFQIRGAFNSQLQKTQGGVLLYYTRYENSGSASSGRLQQIERTVIQLRYGIYDQINYQYLPEALKYDIFNIHFQGQIRPVAEFVPGYEDYLKQCSQKYLSKGLRRNFINPIILERLNLVLRGLIKNPIWTVKKIYKRLVK